MQLPERQLGFPPKSVGLVYLSNEFPKGVFCWDLDNYYEAKGTLIIPSGKMVKLDVNNNVPQKYIINVLNKLEPNSIQEIVIAGKSFTNDILKPINHLVGLKFLRIILTSITNLESLTLDSFENLVELDLSFNSIGYSVLLKVKLLTNLEKLYLASCNLCNTHLNGLDVLAKLQALSLRLNDISDEGIRYLERLIQLRFLDLSGTQITDNGLIGLTNLYNLKEMVLESTFISKEGVKQFKNLLPNCNIRTKPI